MENNRMRYIDLFNLKVVKSEKESNFFISREAISNIIRNEYRVFETEIPYFDGTTNRYILRRKKINSYPVALYTNGIKVETETSPKYVSYIIYNEKNEVKGNLCVNEENTIGFYYINDNKVIITSRTTGVPTEECLVAMIEEVEDEYENVEPCGNNDSTTESFEETNIVVNRVTSVNNTYCVRVLWEISYTLYSQLISAQNYTIEEFIETINNVLNQAYNTDNNDSTFQFEVSGIISYTTANSDPNVGASVFDVGLYATNNYSSTYDYDIVFRLDADSASYAGIAVCGGAYGGIYRSALGKFWTSPVNLDTDSFNSFYARLETTVHEIGHNFGLAHTHDDNCGSFTTVQVCSPRCDYIPGGQDTPPCDSVMSYCIWRQLGFHPTRMDDLNNFVETYGGDLLCNVTPNEPYILLSITDTNMTSSEFSYTVQLKDCSSGQWYTYGTDFLYSDFSLIVLLSELPFSSECYEYLITEQTTNQTCTGTVYRTPEPTPSVSATPIPPGSLVLYVNANYSPITNRPNETNAEYIATISQVWPVPINVNFQDVIYKNDNTSFTGQNPITIQNGNLTSTVTKTLSIPYEILTQVTEFQNISWSVNSSPVPEFEYVITGYTYVGGRYITPTPTISITPSVTPTISFTPTVTVSNTPTLSLSITPSITNTVTPYL